jgi:hypothetical protein
MHPQRPQAPRLQYALISAGFSFLLLDLTAVTAIIQSCSADRHPTWALASPFAIYAAVNLCVHRVSFLDLVPTTVIILSCSVVRHPTWSLPSTFHVSAAIHPRTTDFMAPGCNEYLCLGIVPTASIASAAVRAGILFGPCPHPSMVVQPCIRGHQTSRLQGATSFFGPCPLPSRCMYLCIYGVRDVHGSCGHGHRVSLFGPRAHRNYYPVLLCGQASYLVSALTVQCVCNHVSADRKLRNFPVHRVSSFLDPLLTIDSCVHRVSSWTSCPQRVL